MNLDDAIKVLKTERTCVKRQGTSDCCRESLGCNSCDLVLQDTTVIAAYDYAIEKLNDYPFLIQKVAELSGQSGRVLWHMLANNK